MTSKTFDAKTASLTELNRELKRLASRKCRAKSDEEKAQFAAEYASIDKVKQARFGQKRYLDWSEAEIAAADLQTAVKGVKSLQSAKTLYPERHGEILPKLAQWIERRNDLQELAKFEELKAKLNK